MRPLVSVVMPVRNAAATLPAALESLRAQTLPGVELLALDHASTDRTPEILEVMKCTYAHMRISAFPQEMGFAEVLNRGIAMAEGALIARMDADDVCHPERLRMQAARLQGEPELGVVASRVAFGGDAVAQAGYARHVEWSNGLLSHEDLALARFRESPLAHPSVMFRRELADRHGGYRDGPFPEDYELWLRWFDAGVRFGKLPETLLTWNDPPQRLSRTHPRYAPDAFYAVKADYLARWLARNNPHHPDVVVVGAGRVTRRRVEKLLENGVRVKAWADLDPGKIGRVYHGAPVIRHDDLPPPGAAFVVPFVSSTGAADYIRALLESRGFVRGRDFIEAA
jgi:glycosyltransferase involved in cell wall biosynthesis